MFSIDFAFISVHMYLFTDIVSLNTIQYVCQVERLLTNFSPPAITLLPNDLKHMHNIQEMLWDKCPSTNNNHIANLFLCKQCQIFPSTKNIIIMQFSNKKKYVTQHTKCFLYIGFLFVKEIIVQRAERHWKRASSNSSEETIRGNTMYK